MDLDVEIFDNGLATGLEFYVQLKATESSKGRPAVSLKMATLNYWRSLDRPVLLVLWSNDEDIAWYRWQHEIDTYKTKPHQKTIKVSFPSDRILDADAWSDIESEVRAHRAVRNVRESLPLRLKTIATGTINGISSGVLKTIFQSRLKNYSDLVSTSGSGSPEFRVKIQPSSVEIGTASLPSTTIHYPTNAQRGPEPTHEQHRYAADILIGVAFQLYRMDLATEAATIIREQWRESTVVSSDHLANCMLILAEAGMMAEAIELAGLADRHELQPGIGLLSTLTLATRSPSWGAKIGTELASWAEQKRTDGDLQSASIALVNAGRAIRPSDPVLGIAMFDEAARCNPDYKHRPYWWRERAEMLFAASRYKDSAESYEQAVTLGAEECTEYQGDALLFAGKYAASIPLLSSADPERVRSSAFRLAAACIPYLLEVLQVETQERDIEGAIGDWDFHNPTEDMCFEVLARDALCAPALIWLAERHSEHGLDVKLALCAAITEPTVPILWDAALSVCPIGEPNIYRDALLTARRLCGPALIEHLIDRGEYDRAHQIEEEFEALPPDEPLSMDYYIVSSESSSFDHVQGYPE